MESKKAVVFSRVQLSYQSVLGETAALHDINFHINKGEFVAFVGPSGCGKTTILSLIAGLLSQSAGEIEICGQPAGNMRHKVGYMLQHDLLLPWYNVTENMLLGARIQGLNMEKAAALIQNYVEQYGLSGFEKSYPGALSGGMRQRAALIRTMACEPEILLLDEPFSALDYQTRITVSDDISRIIRTQGATALLVTHDISEAISLADRVIVLSRRPASVKKEVEIHLNQNDTVIEKRKSPLFGQLFNTIWKELDLDESNK